jgi:hypothetical protein
MLVMPTQIRDDCADPCCGDGRIDPHYTTFLSRKSRRQCASLQKNEAPTSGSSSAPIGDTSTRARSLVSAWVQPPRACRSLGRRLITRSHRRSVVGSGA